MKGSVQYSLHSATIIGVNAHPVEVEVVVSSGMPGFSIVGMPDAAIHESRERVRAALRACGFTMPMEKVVVNLAPGSLRKTGSGFDLPIAVALLAATKQIPVDYLDKLLVVGELSLDGKVRAIKGLLAYEVCARANNWELLCAQPDDGLVSIDGLTVKTLGSLSVLRSCAFGQPIDASYQPPAHLPDFCDVGGHAAAKRALTIAATGNHGLLMMGPPGSGKTMLASRLPGILPPLTQAERMQTALIHSIAGEDISSVLAGVRPFRSPHHSATGAGLVGGGNPIRPGELSLAHNGVLFLDELAEFKPNVLQSIRQPMEDHQVMLTRAEGNISFPARFMLIAASNPCPCGHFGDKGIECTCTLPQVQKYQNRIGGPLIDRFDMNIDVWRSDFKQVVATERGSTTSQMRDTVLAARDFAAARARKTGLTDGIRNVAALLSACALSDADKDFLENIASSCHMSGRGIMRTLSVARTIADIEQCERVATDHIAEAVTMRMHGGEGA